MKVMDRWCSLVIKVFRVKHFNYNDMPDFDKTIAETHSWMRRQAWAALKDALLELITWGHLAGRHRITWMMEN